MVDFITRNSLCFDLWEVIMAKGRSPNYPQMILEEALERVRRVYDAEHTHTADKEVIANVLGYSSLNGASVATIGTLRRYGLLEDEGAGLRVSDDAVTVLELPKGDSERSAALKRLAFMPSLFAEIKDTFGDTLPSDVNLRHYLIKKKFLPKAADEAIRTYRANLEFVAGESREYNAGGKEPTVKQGEPVMQSPPAKAADSLASAVQPSSPASPTARRELLSSERELKFNISRDTQARVIFTGPVTQEGIEKLAVLLDVSKDTFPTKAELEQPRSAIWRNKDHDQPVTVTGVQGEHDGRRYMKIDGSDTGVPENELEYTEAKGAA
jgi:hypothetical protein